MEIAPLEKKGSSRVFLKEVKPGERFYLSKHEWRGDTATYSADESAVYKTGKLAEKDKRGILVVPEDKDRNSVFLGEDEFAYVIKGSAAGGQKLSSLPKGTYFRFAEISEDEALKTADGALLIFQVSNEQPAKTDRVKIVSVDGKTPARECDADRMVVTYSRVEVKIGY